MSAKPYQDLLLIHGYWKINHSIDPINVICSIILKFYSIVHLMVCGSMLHWNLNDLFALRRFEKGHGSSIAWYTHSSIFGDVSFRVESEVTYRIKFAFPSSSTIHMGFTNDPNWEEKGPSDIDCKNDREWTFESSYFGWKWYKDQHFNSAYPTRAEKFKKHDLKFISIYKDYKNVEDGALYPERSLNPNLTTTILDESFLTTDVEMEDNEYPRSFSIHEDEKEFAKEVISYQFGEAILSIQCVFGQLKMKIKIWAHPDQYGSGVKPLEQRTKYYPVNVEARRLGHFVFACSIPPGGAVSIEDYHIGDNDIKIGVTEGKFKNIPAYTSASGSRPYTSY